ncbi:hypothetical protein [Streptomyces sp. NPDC001530]
MGAILVAAFTKIGIAIAEAIAVRLMWEMWTAYSRSHRMGAAAA